MHGLKPTVICQCYFTTDDARAVLVAEPDLAQTDAAIIHLGLNDCANRIFLERERLALSLLPEGLRDRILSFARVHRRLILTTLPGRHYVEIERYRANLDALVATLRAGGCSRILLTTTIMPPSRSWPATPGLNWNFTRYNLAVMACAHDTGAVLFDYDRLVYEHGQSQMLLPDGMHLSDAGHTLFTREAIKLLKA